MLNAAIVCAGNPSHCKQMRVLITFTVLAHQCWNSHHCAKFIRTVLYDSLLLDSEYSECSGDLRVSVGTPELQLINTFINVLSLCK